MAHNYYCTSCGKALSQETVLIDMQRVLSAVGSFKTLKFRMTLKEVEELIKSGTPAEDNFRSCKITFRKFVECVANENNLGSAQISELTIQDIIDYTSEIDFAPTEQKSTKQHGFFDDDDDEDDAEQPAEEAAAPAEKPKSAAIIALERKSTKVADASFTKSDLKPDLELVRSLFDNESQTYCFKLKAQRMPADDNTSVFLAYTAYVGQGSADYSDAPDARVCPKCGTPLFEHAGLAEHKLITFIGSQKSGKTSTIVSLVDFSRSALTLLDPRNPIWGNNGAFVKADEEIYKHLRNVEVCDLRSPSKRLSEDLDYYHQGISPVKTPLEPGHAYSATFEIKNNVRASSTLLTLTDIPGELLDIRKGTILKTETVTNFPAALACDGMVLCFDAASDPAELTETAIGVSSCANAFQELIAEKKHPGKAVPMMITFNKCADLEEDTPLAMKNIANAVARSYVFRDEKSRMEAAKNFAYEGVRKAMSKKGFLEQAYQSHLRIAPFGHPAPSAADIDLAKQEGRESEVTNRRPDGSIIYPRPRNIQKLMYWILAVSGCIPVDSKYEPKPHAPEPECYMPKGYVFSRIQFRSDVPNKRDGDLQEAAARCYLFENPGTVDRDYVQNFNNWAALSWTRTFGKNNLRE